MYKEFDDLIVNIVDYVADHEINSKSSYGTARLCLFDALACAFLGMRFPECKNLMGPLVGDEIVPDGSRVPGTHYELNPVEAAFNTGIAIRWLDYNDTWLAAEWGHPSDNIGGILAVCDYVARWHHDHGDSIDLPMRDVLTAIIKAYEIQGILSLENSLNQIGLDHVSFVRIATAAVTTHLLGGNKDKIATALSHAFIDGYPLRTYRHTPNVGPRKSWAAGDATSRGVWLAQMAMRGTSGFSKALSAEKWGLYDVLFNGEPLKLPRELDSYVIDNILFKVSFPAEFHGQTAVEGALQLFDQVNLKWDKIKRIVLKTQEPAMRIIDKRGELHNPADRDHCLQYMVAAALTFGELKADHYSDHFARDPRIDKLRSLMEVHEYESFTEDYYDPNKRAIPNAIQIFFEDGTETEEIVTHYPIGHQKRREEALSLLEHKLHQSIMTHFPAEQFTRLLELYGDQKQLESMMVDDFLNLLVKR